MENDTLLLHLIQGDLCPIHQETRCEDWFSLHVRAAHGGKRAGTMRDENGVTTREYQRLIGEE